MDYKTKIVVISHALVNKVNQRRWKLLSSDPKFEVHLLIPKYWESNWFGEKIYYNSKDCSNNNFHIHTFATTNVKKWTKYFFKSFNIKLNRIKPDLIYIIHGEGIWIHLQIYLYKLLFSSKSKIIFFSMNDKGVKTNNFLKKILWKCIKINTNASLVHTPLCVRSLRSGGYKKPIFIQTQIGVDESIFQYNKSLRKKIRRELNFENKFVIGYAGRLAMDKGVDDIYKAFPHKLDNLVLLLVGDGPLRNEINDFIKKNNIKNKIHITGFVKQEDVPKYMNAMDIFVLGSKPGHKMLDTFPLVTVQAQACKLPIISSDIDALKWQLDNTALYYKAGDIEELEESMLYCINNKNLLISTANKGFNRTEKYFCQSGMTENFKKMTKQILSSNYTFHEDKEEYTQWKAY